MMIFLFNVIAKLPNALAQQLGKCIGSYLFYTHHKERKVAEANINLCFKELSEKQRLRLTKQTLQENAKTLLELPRIFTQSGDKSVQRITEVEGLEHYKKALANSNGVLILAPHLGNWELVIHYLNQFGTITAMYSPPKKPFLNDIMRKARESTGASLVPADAKGVRSLLKTLKTGGIVGILPDQVPKHQNAGVYAPFMNNPAFTMTLVNNLAKRSNATIVMAFAKRLPTGKGYKLYILPAPQGIDNADPVIAATAMNNGIEQCVNIAPEQYQWTYKRFKNTDNAHLYK